MNTLMLCLSAMLVGVLAMPDPAADPQHYSKPPAYPKPAPTYPTYKPSYKTVPAYPKPAQNKQPAYGQKYKSEYDYCDPRAPPTCSNNGTESICLKDEEYPEKEVQYAIEYDPLALKKYADIADQSADNLVDGLTSLGENHFDYTHYNGKQFDQGNWVGGEGYICPSDVAYARPVRAANVEGEWRVIVQDVHYYTQTQRLESCLFPEAACRTLAPCYRSTCVQKYVHHRMLSFDPCDPQRGLFIDIYKLPSACSCHIPSKLH